MIRSGVLPDRISRRQALQRSGLGMSWLACASMLSESSASDGEAGNHHQATADRVLFLFMDGGPSQVDQNGKCFASPFRFQKYGDSGLEISELFPHLSKYADDLCVIRSMKSEFAEHSQACMYLHTGFAAQGRPSMGAWLGYGLGTENKQLPSYVVVHGGLLPIGGPENFSSAFLPAVYSGSIFDSFSGGELVRNITPGVDVGSQRELLNR